MTESPIIWGLDPRIWQALIAGAVVAAGWLVNGWQNRRAASREAQLQRNEAASLRAERLRDVHRALYAEIGANLSNLSGTDALDADVSHVLELMRTDESYIPFLPREDRSIVFKSVIQDIHVLPRTTINAVVAYYAQLSSISALIDDIRSEAYPALPVDRRIAIYTDLMILKRQALEFGNYALRIIKEYGDNGPEAAKALESKMKQGASSQRAEDPSAP